MSNRLPVPSCVERAKAIRSGVLELRQDRRALGGRGSCILAFCLTVICQFDSDLSDVSLTGRGALDEGLNHQVAVIAARVVALHPANDLIAEIEIELLRVFI